MAFLWGAVVMRAMAVVACGFALVACSASTPSLSFLSPSRLRPKHCGSNRNHRGPKSKPPWGKTCHTPCNITSQLIPDLTATFALSGYESQAVVVQVAASTAATSAQFASNPVYVELRPVPVAAPLKNRVSRQLKKKRAVAKSRHSPVAAAAPTPAVTAPISVPTADSSAAQPDVVSATNYPWSDPPRVK
jgi:hypothetical protein